MEVSNVTGKIISKYTNDFRFKATIVLPVIKLYHLNNYKNIKVKNNNSKRKHLEILYLILIY